MKPVAALSGSVFLAAVFLAACPGCDRNSQDKAVDAGTGSGVATGPDRPQDKSGPASAASPGIPGYGTSGASDGSPGASASGSGGPGEPIWSTGSSAASSSGASAGAAMDDGIVSAKVKTALLRDADVRGADIKVEARNGEVLLSGFVKEQAQIDRAVQLAGKVEGVRSVNNKMVLRQ